MVRNYVSLNSIALSIICLIFVSKTIVGVPVAFVTGGASGIGAATIELFMSKGIKVAFLDQNDVLSKEFIKKFNPEDILYIHGDVSKIIDIQKAVKATINKFNRIDIAFINAGIMQMKNVLEMSEDDWQKIIDINLKGAVFTVKELLPHLIKNNGGSIVINCSDQCVIAKPGMCAYGISKAGLAQFTKTTALEFGKYNIRVNAICPATIRTPLAEGVMKRWADNEFNGDEEKVWQIEAAKYPLNRYGNPQEAANLVYFLASEQSSFITGGLYLIDGGLTIS